MKKYSIKNKEFNICERAEIAESFSSRLVGLMFKKSMEGFDGLMITQCNSIHTFFMRYPLDLIFLDKSLKVIKVIENKAPWRMSLMYFSSSQVLEVIGGTLKGRVTKGDQLEMQCIS